jgi:hypothetical protein
MVADHELSDTNDLVLQPCFCRQDAGRKAGFTATCRSINPPEWRDERIDLWANC